MAARFVRQMEGSPMACDRLEALRVVLRCFLNGWGEALQTGAMNGSFGYTEVSQRWGVVYAALWIEWKLPANFWMLSECEGGLRLVCGGLEGKMAIEWISGSESG